MLYPVTQMRFGSAMIEPTDDDWRVHDELFLKMPGSSAFVEWYGGTTAFHDAEIERIEILSNATVIIDIHCERLRAPAARVRPTERLIVLTLLDVASLELSQLHTQNVIFSLTLRAAAPPEPARPTYVREFRAGDIEVEIVPSVGIGGSIHCGSASITMRDWPDA